MRSVAALLLLLASAQALPAQYCAPAAYLKQIFGSGVTIAGTIANTTTTRQVIYTEADGSPQFDPMDQACGLYNVSGAAGGSIACLQMKPNTAYYIHPSYDGSTHRDCQTETAAFSCNGFPNFATAGAGEAACEIETDADGANEVIKIRTPDDGSLPPAPDPPVFSRVWDEGYTQTPDASATVTTASSGGELLATDFLAKVTAAVDYLKANPANTYTVTIPPRTRIRRENEGGVGAQPNVHGFEIPACNGGETGMLIIESSTADPDAMPPIGATPTGNEDWAHIEWNRYGVLTNTSPTLISYAEPPCPIFYRGVTIGAPPHEIKERWTATGFATVTLGGTHESDSVLLDFTGSTPDVSDAWPTVANAGITVAGLRGDIFHNFTDAEMGVTVATQFCTAIAANCTGARSGDTIEIANKAALGSPAVWSELIADGGRVGVNPVTGQIAFDKLVGSFFEVHLADADGSNVSCLSCGRGDLPARHIGNPVWSPDGNWIVMQAQAAGASWDSLATPGIGVFNYFYAYDVVGDTAYNIHTVPLTLPSKGLLHPQFNHAGTQLMWAEMTDGTGGFNGTWKIVIADWDAGTHTLSNLTDYAPSSKTFYETHGWNDDGLILYSAAAGSFSDIDIWSWDLVGSPTNLTDDVAGAWDEHAHFTRDGAQIAWMSSRGQSFSPLETDFWIMDADGTDKRRLTNFNSAEAPEYQGYDAIAADFDWSADGSQIIGYVQENDGVGYDSGRLIRVNRTGEARLHNIISLPFSSASGALLTTPEHPYVDSPQTPIVSFVDGVVTTAFSHGASYLSGGNTIWLQGTDDGAAGNCDGFYANISGGTPGSDSGRDTTTMSLQAINGATGASIPDCNTANGTVQIVGVAMVASDSYPDGIACYVSFPSATQVRLELCTETGLSASVPDLTGETGYISYDPPTLPTIMTHPGGAPLHMTNVTIRANRPWRIERALQLNGTGLTTEEAHLTGINSDIGLWVPVPPNSYSSGAMAMTRISSFEFSQVLRLWGRSRVRLGPGKHSGGGFGVFGQEFGRPMPTDIRLNQWRHEVPNRAVSGESSIVEPIRQLQEGKGGFDRWQDYGSIYIGMPEHNSPVSVVWTCKTNANGYNADPVLTSTCSNIDFRWSFWSAPQLIKSGVTENGNASAKFEWTAYRKIRFSDNVVRMRARKGFIHGEHLTFNNYSATSFQVLPFVFTRTGDMAFDRNLWLPHLGTDADSNGLWNKLTDPGVQLGSRYSWKDNIHVDNVINNSAGGRFGGNWTNAVENVYLADGAFSPLADISGNPIAYCQNDSLDADYAAPVADACTRGATYWQDTGYADAFDPVECNTSESCAARAARILDLDGNEPLPAFSGKGPTGGITRVLDEMGVIRNVQVERRTDGTAARISYHAPAADRLCKAEWAEDGADFDAVASGVSSVWDTAGSQERQVTIEGLTNGVSYDYRVRCVLTAGSVRGEF